MKRREVVKSLGLTAFAMGALPSWANGWSKERIGEVGYFNIDQKNMLGDLVGLIIPETDTPGAKTLGVDSFIELMLKDCYGKDAKTAFEKGMHELQEVAVETFSKSFELCDEGQKLHLLEGLQHYDDQELVSFYKMLKGLTIRGYKHSEHYHNITGFEFAPARYNGCVDIEEA